MANEIRQDFNDNEVYTSDLIDDVVVGGGGGGRTTTYFCVIDVKRSDNMMPISGASIRLYTLPYESYYVGTIGTTNSSGRCIVRYGSNKSIYFKATKEGYTQYSSNFMGATPRSTLVEAKAVPVQILLTPASVANYYYSVRVEDQSGNGMPGVKINLFSDLTMKNHYDGTVISGGGSKYVKEDSTPSRLDIFDEIKDIFFTVVGSRANNLSIDSKYASETNITQAEMTRVIDYIEQKYRIIFEYDGDILLDKENINEEGGKTINTPSLYIDKTDYVINTYPYIRDLVTYVLDNTDFVTNKNIIYTTNNDGYVIIKITDSTVQPKTIYAYGFDGDYTWTSRQGPVPPNTDTSVGRILTVSVGTGLPDTYYYNLQLIDSLTNKPVKNATVKYIKDGVLLSTETTDDSGKVSYNCKYGSLTVNISKDGYDEINLSSSDSDEDTDLQGKTTDEYVSFNLDQTNPIQVVKMEESESETEPAAGITVGIGYYDSQKNYISCGKYTTAETGYIEGISTGYFSSKNITYYAIVLNYVPADPAMNYALRKRLVLGGVTIVLPPQRTNEDEGNEEYMQFYDVSANAIKNNINNGNQELNSKQMTDKVSYTRGDDYRINVLNPDSITTYDIFQSKPVMMEENNKSVIGSIDIGLKYDVNKLRLKVINRYSGYYNPIFKDVLFYKNFIYSENELPFSNVSFDYDYSDKYGKFGTINNIWFHKVNDDKTITILNTSTPYYPLTGQYALDHKDYNVFESSWDLEHYTKQLDLDHSRPCANISSQKNGLCMFGSKYLNVPERIEIYGLTLGDDENWNGEWNDDWITSPDACPGEVMFKEINDNSVDYYFFFTKRIHRFFYNKLKGEFEKYINVDNGSYGKPGIEDDIKEYVAKNVLKLYKLEKVRMFVKRTKKGQHNSKIENDYTTYLEYDKTSNDANVIDYFRKKGYVHYFKQHGFVEVNNITLSKINRDDFDRKLTYNLRNGAKEEFAFSFILTKI